MDWKLTGYKTTIGAVGVMLTAIGKLMADYYYGYPIDLAAFIVTFSAGFGILGLGSKLARTKTG